MSKTYTKAFKFQGKGAALFEIFIVNILLKFVTLNFYYPWAKVRELKYIYGKMELFGSPLSFHAKGKELFIGYLKTILVFAIIIGPYFYFAVTNQYDYILPAFAFMYVGMLSIIPLAIHGSLKYRMAKTAWRGVRFGYRGELATLYKKCFIGFLLTLVTFGIYGSWMVVDIRSYITKHLRMGDVRFSFNGEGSDLFLIMLKGYFLSIITLGIYGFWWQNEIFQFHVNNTRIYQNGESYRLKAQSTGFGFLELLVVNWLIVTFTFGLGTPFAIIRSMRFYMEHMEAEEGFNPDIVTQTEKDYNDALAEDLSDFMDIAIF